MPIKPSDPDWDHTKIVDYHIDELVGDDLSNASEEMRNEHRAFLHDIANGIGAVSPAAVERAAPPKPDDPQLAEKQPENIADGMLRLLQITAVTRAHYRRLKQRRSEN